MPAGNLDENEKFRRLISQLSNPKNQPGNWCSHMDVSCKVRDLHKEEGTRTAFINVLIDEAQEPEIITSTRIFCYNELGYLSIHYPGSVPDNCPETLLKNKTIKLNEKESNALFAFLEKHTKNRESFSEAFISALCDHSMEGAKNGRIHATKMLAYVLVHASSDHMNLVSEFFNKRIQNKDQKASLQQEAKTLFILATELCNRKNQREFSFFNQEKDTENSKNKEEKNFEVWSPDEVLKKFENGKFNEILNHPQHVSRILALMGTIPPHQDTWPSIAATGLLMVNQAPETRTLAANLVQKYEGIQGVDPAIVQAIATQIEEPHAPHKKGVGSTKQTLGIGSK